MTNVSENLVSICIPAYNAEMYIKESIESARKQTHQNIEIICVDDGSTDNTADVLNTFGNDITVIKGSNKGAPVARNLALSRANGKFIQFLDADNVMHPEKIEMQLPTLVNNKADLVFCNKQISYKDGRIETRPPPPNPDGIDPLIYCLNFNLPGKRAAIDTEVPLHRRSILERIGGFREGVMRGQDKDLTYRLAAAGARFAYVDKTLMTYREHEGPRISSKKKIPSYDLELLIEIFDIISTSSSYAISEEQKRCYAERALIMSRNLLKSGYTTEYLKGAKFSKDLGVRFLESDSISWRLMTILSSNPISMNLALWLTSKIC